MSDRIPSAKSIIPDVPLVNHDELKDLLVDLYMNSAGEALQLIKKQRKDIDKNLLDELKKLLVDLYMNNVGNALQFIKKQRKDIDENLLDKLKDFLVNFYMNSTDKALQLIKEQGKDIDENLLSDIEYFSLFVWGTFGIGKSYVVKEAGKHIAASLGKKYSSSLKDINDPDKFVVIVIPLHQFDIAELKGIGFPDKEAQVTKFFSPEVLPKTGQGIIFLDELNLAPPAVQANAYQLVLERRLGSYVLPPGYIVVAAGNTQADRAYIHSMAHPLRNRFLHVQLDISNYKQFFQQWKEFALIKNLDQRVIGFLSSKPEYLHRYNPEKDRDSYAIPTPRMWEKVAKLIQKVQDVSSPSSERLLKLKIASAVGVAVANEFIAWMKLALNYDIDKILCTGVIENFPESQTDVRLSLGSSIAYYYSHLSDEEKDKYFYNFIKAISYFDQEEKIWLISSSILNTQDAKAFIERLKQFPEDYEKIKNLYIKLRSSQDYIEKQAELKSTLDKLNQKQKIETQENTQANIQKNSVIDELKNKLSNLGKNIDDENNDENDDPYIIPSLF